MAPANDDTAENHGLWSIVSRHRFGMERKRVYRVRKVVAVPVLLEVRHELVDVLRHRAERAAAGREMDVADDLVHACRHPPTDTMNTEN